MYKISKTIILFLTSTLSLLYFIIHFFENNMLNIIKSSLTKAFFNTITTKFEGAPREYYNQNVEQKYY